MCFFSSPFCFSLFFFFFSLVFCCFRFSPPGTSHRHQFPDFSANGVLTGPTMGHAMGGVMYDGSCNGWGHVC